MYILYDTNISFGILHFGPLVRLPAQSITCAKMYTYYLPQSHLL